MKFEVILIYRF